MKFVKEVKMGEMIPPWYGVAYVRYELNAAVCLPIPLNVIVAVSRSVYAWLRYGHRSVLLVEREAYWQGVADERRKAK